MQITAPPPSKPDWRSHRSPSFRPFRHSEKKILPPLASSKPVLYYPVGGLLGKLTVTAKLVPARPCGVRRHDAALELGDMSPSGSCSHARARPPPRAGWGRPRPHVPKFWAGARPPEPTQKTWQSDQIRPNQTKSNHPSSAPRPRPPFASFAIPPPGLPRSPKPVPGSAQSRQKPL